MAKKIFTAEDIIMRDIDDCIPYEDNPRLNDGAVDDVAMSIEQFGFNIPIILDENDVIVTGHTRKKAAKKLGMKRVPTISAAHLSEDQIRAFRLADNRVSENAKWDDEALKREMDLLSGAGFSLEFTGFNKDEIDCLTTEVNGSCLDDLSADLVCGEIDDAKAHVVASKRVSVSVGSYKLYVSKEAYQAWEEQMLVKHGTKVDIVRHVAAVLGFKDAEFSDKA